MGVLGVSVAILCGGGGGDGVGGEGGGCLEGRFGLSVEFTVCGVPCGCVWKLENQGFQSSNAPVNSHEALPKPKPDLWGSWTGARAWPLRKAKIAFPIKAGELPRKGEAGTWASQT